MPFDKAYHQLLDDLFIKVQLPVLQRKYSRENELADLVEKLRIEDRIKAIPKHLDKIPSPSSLYNFYDPQNQKSSFLERLTAIRDLLYSTNDEEQKKIIRYIVEIRGTTSGFPRWNAFKKKFQESATPEYAVFYAYHQYTPLGEIPECKVSHLKITRKTLNGTWDTGEYSSFEQVDGEIKIKASRMGEFSKNPSQSVFFNAAYDWEPDKKSISSADRQTHMIFTSTAANPERMSFLAGTFIAKADDGSAIAGAFIAKKVADITEVKKIYSLLIKDELNIELKEITDQLRNKLIKIKPHSIKDLAALKHNLSSIVGLPDKRQYNLEEITDNGGYYICLRASDNGRWIHINKIRINRKGIVEVTEFDKKNTKERKHKTKSRQGHVYSFDENRFLLEINAEAVIHSAISLPSVYIFERHKKQNEYRGFAIGFEFENKEPPSSTRCLLFPITPDSELLKICPLDISVNILAFKEFPLNDINNYMPMRLGGVFDNAMNFFDAKNDEPQGPEIKLGDVFYSAAKELLGREKKEMPDYLLAINYLIKSAEHASDIYFHKNDDVTDNIDQYEELLNKYQIDKLIEDTKNNILKNNVIELRRRISGKIKLHVADTLNKTDEQVISIIKHAFDKKSDADQ